MRFRRIQRPRRNATIVRFRAQRLPSGLYRHRAVKILVTVHPPDLRQPS
jgi:hypothetical protein